ncbi:uncharacterized protein LOC125864119 [Solanum stenotomum]|uniref:uncharacterized protein LOC125864119 n=1 Tax=Solanum stenotomum TaxID=172797 RepID=UPI0020D00551|nr:uncharacterized protein LOC125864119 [Solanum stenotomum]
MEGGQHDGLEKSPNGDISNEGDIVAAAIGMHQSNFESFQDLEDISIDAVMKVSQKERSIVGVSGVTPHSMEVVKTEALQQISLGSVASSAFTLFTHIFVGKMGGGRRTETFVRDSASSSSTNQRSNSGGFRYLTKNQLGGVIFGCTVSTMNECLRNQLFGLPAPHISYVKNIDPGLPLFLFNYSNRELHGIYEAASSGRMNINPYGWTLDGSGRTEYPAQVQVRLRLHCRPLAESLFKPIIQENYYHDQRHFMFELDHVQAGNLISKFSSSLLAPIRSIPQNAPNWRSVMQDAVLRNREENDKVRYAGESSRSGASINRHIVEHSTIAVTNATRHDVKSGEETFHQTDQILREVQNGETSSDLVGYPAESIFLIGGYDGVSWLTALESYSPSNDVVKSLKPMHSVQSYAGVAELCGQLFVFGGGDGGAIGAESLWYDTVVSYRPATNMWSLHPPLKTKKGALAGATWKDRIFAIGGANVIDCFSEVEMYDPQFGCWFNTRPMSQKRSCLAAAELNGALYAVGGYDGSNYLATAERFDPRERSWATIRSMSTRRGCHTLTVLDGKLYALGGYDGSTMVRSTEIYDPRLATWMVVEPMELARGYSAAVVLQDSIYVIGGVKFNEEIVDVIECYKPGVGWKTLNLKGIGRRCICSAIVLTND